MDLFDRVVLFVNDAFKGKQIVHFERTVYWFEKFSPKFSEAHKIAAYAHDIERAFRDEGKKAPENYLDADFLKYHQEKGAEIIAEFLRKKHAPESTIKKVVQLVSKHEVGGNAEQNALMDADSVSFFETNAEMFVTQKAPIEGNKKVKEKLDWMFNRISSREAKADARQNFEKWMNMLK
ncbi:MAG: DUF4202 family protein [Candidatus Taylorbacteria bacterium]